jgi:RNA polymerase sigma factor (sigma-70 family)
MSTGMRGEQKDDRSGVRKTEELFVEHHDFMFAAARKVLRQKADAQDVIQSLFFKLVDSEPPLEVQEDPKGFLYRVVVNACLDWKRSRKRRRESQGVEKIEMEAPRGGRAHENAVHQVEHLLDSLDDDVAEVVMFHADSGYSDGEIAATMGESRSKVPRF